MKVAVIGAGGLGGFLGGLLARAGHEVTFVARGEHLRRIQTDGLRVEWEPGESFTVTGPAVDATSRVGEVDVVLVCTKTYDNDVVIPQLGALLGEQTAVLSLQNGLTSGPELSRAYGSERVLLAPSICEAFVQEPGVIVERLPEPFVVLGEYGGGISRRVERLVAELSRAGWYVEASGEIHSEVWFKTMIMCASGAVMAATRSPLNEVLAHSETRALYHRVMEEVAEVASAKGIELARSGAIPRRLGIEERGPIPEAILRLWDTNLPENVKSSTLRDVEAGRPLEIGAMNGAVSRFAREVGVRADANDILYACLKPLHERALAARAA